MAWGDNGGARDGGDGDHGGGARGNGGDPNPHVDMPSHIFDESEDVVEEDEDEGEVRDNEIDKWLNDSSMRVTEVESKDRTVTLTNMMTISMMTTRKAFVMRAMVALDVKVARVEHVEVEGHIQVSRGVVEGRTEVYRLFGSRKSIRKKTEIRLAQSWLD